jgi:hypothetical protein
MTTLFRGISLSVALAVFASANLSAQSLSLATFGSVEAGGLGEGDAVVGTALSRDRLGWSPVLTLEGIWFRYHDLPDHLASGGEFAPSVGMRDQMSTGDVEGDIGYAFVNLHSELPVVTAVNGTQNSVFISGQANYWGTGNVDGQLIATYAFQSHYIWSRARYLHSVGTAPFLFGGDLTVQGGGVGFSAYRYEIGPAVEFRATPDFHIGIAGGYRTTSGDDPNVATGYVRLDVLLLTKF